MGNSYHVIHYETMRIHCSPLRVSDFVGCRLNEDASYMDLTPASCDW